MRSDGEEARARRDSRAGVPDEGRRRFEGDAVRDGTEAWQRSREIPIRDTVEGEGRQRRDSRSGMLDPAHRAATAPVRPRRDTPSRAAGTEPGHGRDDLDAGDWPRDRREPGRGDAEARARRDSRAGVLSPEATPPRTGAGSDPAHARPADELLGDAEGSRRARRPTPGRADGPDAVPGTVLRRRIPSVVPPVREVARGDSPRSHEVKALIAQRLKLLDQGADHFQLLGVSQDVAPDALRRAYFALARQLHPDRLAALGIFDEGKHAQRLFAQINSGFAVLSDQVRRADYVGVLRKGGEAVVRAEQARAEELARRILDAEEAFRRGELALRRDQPQAAIAELELAVQLNPDEADHHALLAWARFCAAPDKAAVATTTRSSLDKALLRSPKAVTARFYLGRVERMLGRDAEALRHFREVLAAVANHADAAAEVRVLEARMGDKAGKLGLPKR